MPELPSSNDLQQRAREVAQALRYRPSLLTRYGAGFFLVAAWFVPERFELLRMGLLSVAGVLFLFYVGVEARRNQRPPASEDDSEDAAVRGLEPFTGAEAALFRELGRNAEADQAVAWCRGNAIRFVAIHGGHRSGKTSLLMAGILPRLAGELPAIDISPLPGATTFEQVMARARGLAEEAGASLPPGHADAGAPEGHAEAPARSGLRKIVLFIDPFERYAADVRARLVATFACPTPPTGLPEQVTLIAVLDESIFAEVRTRAEACGDELWRALPVEGFEGERAIDVLSTLGASAGLDVDFAVLQEIGGELAASGGGRVRAGDLGIAIFGLRALSLKRRRRRVSLKAYREGGGLPGLRLRFLDNLLKTRYPGLQPEVERALARLATGGAAPVGRSELMAAVQPADGVRFFALLRELSTGDMPILVEEPKGAGDFSYRFADERTRSAFSHLAGLDASSASSRSLLADHLLQIWTLDRRSRKLPGLFDYLRIRDLTAPNPTMRDFLWRTRNRNLLRIVSRGALLLLLFGASQWTQRLFYRELLDGWGLPRDLLDRQRQLQSLGLGEVVSRFEWIAADVRTISARTRARSLPGLKSPLDALHLKDALDLESLRGLPDVLELDLDAAKLQRFDGLPASVRSVSATADS
ncbi:MAG TPA: hypothetical protein VFI63_01335, partial [Solirubrobacterales bacterium]|nr:hypothetical protein [Solirubrobacterales bacterium]